MSQAAQVQVKRDSPTKRRIRDTARDAFNAQGYAQVTTAKLAEALGMAEGNLWYHYRTKQDLVLAIQADFADRCQADFRIDRDADPIEAYGHYLRSWRGLLDDFKFLFADAGLYGSFVADTGYDLRGGINDTVRQNHRLLLALEEAGLTVEGDVDLRDRAQQALVIMTFHYGWLSISAPHDVAAQATAREAVEQHLIVLEGLVRKDVLVRIRRELDA